MGTPTLTPPMMITWKQLSRPLRLAVATPICALAALVTLALTGGVELRLGADHKPFSDVSLSSSHWTDTLDAARLPASVPLYDVSGSLALPGNATSNSRLRIGTLEFQPYSFNNTWIGENVHFSNGAFRPTATGSTSLVSFCGSEVQIRGSSGGTAGEALGDTVGLRVIADGDSVPSYVVALGGAMPSDAGSTYGAALTADISGVVIENSLTVGGYIGGDGANLYGYGPNFVAGYSESASNSFYADSAGHAVLAAGLNGAAGVLTDGVGGLSLQGGLTADEGVFSTLIYTPYGDVGIDLSDPATGVLTDDGTAVLEWSLEGINVPGAFLVGGNATVVGGLSLGGILQLGQFAQAGTTTPTHTLVVYDGTGTAYLVPCVPQ